MTLEGLPDFQAPLQSNSGGRTYYPYAAGSFVALPSALTLAQRSDAGPDLALALIRPSRLGQPPPPGGILDLRLELVYELDETLKLARQHQPAATLAPLRVASGFLRLYAALPGSAVPPSLTLP